MGKIYNAAAASGRGDWTTDPVFYARLNREFGPFKLDAAARQHNTLAPLYCPDAMIDPWEPGPAFCNPPYGRIEVPAWLKRGLSEFSRTGNTTVFLVPASTETLWFQEIAARFASEIRLVKGRLKFGNVLCKDGTFGEAAAPFPSAVVICQRRPLSLWPRGMKAYIRTWDWRKE